MKNETMKWRMTRKQRARRPICGRAQGICRCVLLFCLFATLDLPHAVGDEPATTSDPGPVSKPAEIEASPADVWRTFRGTWTSTGVTKASLPKELELLWTFKVEKGAFEASAAIEGGRVFVADLDGKVFALDLKTGEKVWEYATESGFIASPTLHDKKVYIGDYDGRFYCLDAETGKAVCVF